jgi:hypothetical protein
VKKRKRKAIGQPVFDSIRKPTARLRKGSVRKGPKEKADPVHRKAKHRKKAVSDSDTMFTKKKKTDDRPIVATWARPEMQVTFRAEIMPGRSREERTFRVKTYVPTAG